MNKPTIFVSYSARENEAGKTPDKDRAAALVEELREDGFDPWWDQQGLELNDDWNDTISEALATCHGAVVLLSPVSIESDYVRHEAGYLSVRRHADPEFPLCSFLCDGLAVENIGPFFQAIQFSRLQHKSWEMPNRREALNRALRSTFEAAAIPETPTAALESTLAGEKYFGSIKAKDLRGAASRLARQHGLDRESKLGWQQIRDCKIDAAVSQLFVRHLLNRSVNGQLDALLELGGQLSEVKVCEVFQWVAPFWIDENAASHFARLVEAEPGKRGAVINGSLARFTPEMFARRYRAHARWNPRLFSIESHTATGRVGGLREQMRRSILQRLDMVDSASADEIRRELARLPRRKRLCSVICDADQADLDVLAELQGEFKEVVFVALSGDQPLQIPNQLRERCQVVLPPLICKGAGTRHHETNAHAAYTACLEDLGSDEGDLSIEC